MEASIVNIKKRASQRRCKSVKTASLPIFLCRQSLNADFVSYQSTTIRRI